MPKIYVARINKYVTFPDGMPPDEITRNIEELIASSGNAEEPETDLLGAAKYGVQTIIPKIKSGYGNQAQAIFDILPFDESSEPKFIDRMREDADVRMAELQAKFTPDTLSEKVVAGLAGATGDIATMAPYLLAAAPLAPAALPALGAYGAAALAGGIGLGSHALVEGYGETGDVKEALKRGGIGAAEGAAFGVLGPAGRAAASGIKKEALRPITERLIHASGAGTVGGTSAALQGEDPEDVAAAAATMFGLSGLGYKGQKKKRPGVAELEARAREALDSGDRAGYDEIQRRIHVQSIGRPEESLLKKIPGVKQAANWFEDKWLHSGRALWELAAKDEAMYGAPPAALDPRLTSAPARPAATASAARNGFFFGLFDPMKHGDAPVVGPLVEAYKRAGVTNKTIEGDFNAYATAHREAARAVSHPGQKIDTAGSKDPSAVIRATKRYYPKEQIKKFDRLREDWNEYGNALVDIYRNGGEISAELATQMKTEKDWISLERIVDERVKASPFMRLKGGSGQRVRNPIESLVVKTEQVLRAVNHNEHMRAVVDLIERTGEPGRYMEKLEPRTDTSGKRVARQSFDDQGKTISFRTLGEQESYRLSPELYEAVKPPGRPMLPKAIDFFLAGPKRLATLGYTGLNIGFQTITNPIRDLFSSGMQSKDPGVVFGAKHVKRTFESLIGRAMNDAEFTDAYARYKVSGATASGPLEADIRSTKAFADMFVSRASGPTGAPKQFIKHPIETLRTLFSWSEDVNRFPEWKLAENLYGKGSSEARLRGTSMAAGVSLDFMRMGAYSRWANEFIPFFNASLQGASKFSRTIRERPAAAMAQGVTNITGPMMALWAINKDEEWYQEIPTWEKTIFAHFKIGNEIIRMPLPFEWGIMFGSLPVAAADAAYRKDPKRLKDGVDQAIKTMMPDVWPQFIKPIAEATANKNFFKDSTIESKSMERMLPAERYRESTPALYKGLGGVTGTSPVKMQHLAEAYTGGLSKQITDPIDFLSGYDQSSQKIPIVGRIMASQDRQGQSVEDFYSKHTQMQQVWTTAKKKHEAGDILAARRILEDNSELLGIGPGNIALLTRRRNWTIPDAMKRYNKIAKKMSDVRKRKGESKEITALARLAIGR